MYLRDIQMYKDATEFSDVRKTVIQLSWSFHFQKLEKRHMNLKYVDLG